MKTKKFDFQQTVVTQVTTKYNYRVKAKSFGEAEKKIKKLFEKQAEAGNEHLAIKKLKPEKSKIDVTPISPIEAGESTVRMEYVTGKKKKTVKTKLYDNLAKIWGVPEEQAIEEKIEETKIEEVPEKPVEEAPEVG